MSKGTKAGTSPAAEDDKPARQGIQSIEIGARVLLAMEGSAGPMGLIEIAGRADMEPSKVHRYLVSLRRSGLVSQAPSGGYDYGPTMRRLGAEALRRTNEVAVASDWIPGLRDSTRHSINLSVWGEDGPIVVRWDHGSFALPLTVRVGSALPLASSSAGQVFLATLPESLTERALANAAEGNGRQKLSATKLRAAKAAVRRDGVAITRDGVVPGIASISAPIQTSDGLPLVVSVVLPAEELTPAEQARVSALLLETTGAVEHELGSTTE
jgi:DNA-binding IclR family transcriptional regulator